MLNLINRSLNRFIVNADVGNYTTAPIKGITIPNFTDVLSFLIRTFFIVAGILAILYLLLGAFAWITSGGSKESVDKARDKIQAALIGIILIFIVLTIVVVIENIFGVGLGISKAIQFPTLNILNQ